MLHIGHIDEVDNNDAAQIAQPQLPSDCLGSLHIGLVNRLFQIAVTNKRTGIDVDGGHSFGLVYDQMSSRLEVRLCAAALSLSHPRRCRDRTGSRTGVVFDLYFQIGISLSANCCALSQLSRNLSGSFPPQASPDHAAHAAATADLHESDCGRAGFLALLYFAQSRARKRISDCRVASLTLPLQYAQ